MVNRTSLIRAITSKLVHPIWFGKVSICALYFAVSLARYEIRDVVCIACGHISINARLCFTSGFSFSNLECYSYNAASFVLLH